MANAGYHNEWKEGYHTFATLSPEQQMKLAPLIDKIYKVLCKEAKDTYDLSQLYMDERSGPSILKEALGVRREWLKTKEDYQNISFLECVAYYRRYKDLHVPTIDWNFKR